MLARSARRPVRLVVDANRLGDPVHVVEVRDDLDRVVDGGVAPAERAKGLRVLRGDGRRLERQLQREVAERADARLEIGGAIVVQRVLGQLVGCALGTEVVGMRASSVVAVVRVRDDNGEELALDPREL